MSEAFLQTLKKLFNRRIGVLLLLGFASGLPLELTGGTLQLWLADEGVNLTALATTALLPLAPGPATLPGMAQVQGIDLTVIALFSLVGLPYLFKFLWSPLMDRYVPPFLGRRRGWMLLTQLALIAGLLGMAATSPMKGPAALAALALVVAFASASQDIVLDAYRTDILHDRERGFGAAVNVMGYRIAMLVAGGVAAVIGDHAGWSAAYVAMAALMGVGVIATFIAPDPTFVERPPKTLAAAVVEPLREFFSRSAARWSGGRPARGVHGERRTFTLQSVVLACAFILCVVLYKFGDAFASTLFTTFLRRELDFSPTDIGLVRKSVGFASVMGGMLVGGLLMARLGLFRSLLVFGILQALSNVLFIVLAEVGHDYTLMVTTIAVENVTGGMGTAAFVALLMALCDHRFTATQYALLSALAAFARVSMGPLAGPAIEAMGWSGFFALTIAISVPALGLLIALRGPIRALERDPDTT